MIDLSRSREVLASDLTYRDADGNLLPHDERLDMATVEYEEKFGGDDERLRRLLLVTARPGLRGLGGRRYRRSRLGSGGGFGGVRCRGTAGSRRAGCAGGQWGSAK